MFEDEEQSQLSESSRGSRKEKKDGQMSEDYDEEMYGSEADQEQKLREQLDDSSDEFGDDLDNNSDGIEL